MKKDNNRPPNYASKKPTNEILIELIYAKEGNLTEIAKSVGVVRRTVEGWLAKNEKLRQARQDAKEAMIDFTESKARQLIKGIPLMKKDKETGEMYQAGWVEKPDATMIKYMLSTQAKNRGYIVQEDKNLNISGSLTVDFSSDDE